ncbi:hypothetical protein ACUH92_08840 [Dermabacteraceae bacterium CCM 9520]
MEADTSGYSPTLAGFFQGSKRQSSSLLDLASAADFGDHLTEHSIKLTDEEIPIKRLIPAITNPKHSHTLSTHWARLTQEFSLLDSKGVDVIIDLGRANSNQFPFGLLQASDLALILLKPGIPEVKAVKSLTSSFRLEEMNSEISTPLQLVTVAAPHTYSAREVSKALNLPTLHTLPYEPTHAAAFSHGIARPKNFDTSSYVKSLSHLAESAHKQAEKHRLSLDPES